MRNRMKYWQKDISIYKLITFLPQPSFFLSQPHFSFYLFPCLFLCALQSEKGKISKCGDPYVRPYSTDSRARLWKQSFFPSSLHSQWFSSRASPRAAVKHCPAIYSALWDITQQGGCLLAPSHLTCYCVLPTELDHTPDPQDLPQKKRKVVK